MAWPVDECEQMRKAAIFAADNARVGAPALLLPWANHLLNELTQRFVNLPPPCDATELAWRQTQQEGLKKTRNALLAANDWVRLFAPSSAATIADDCKAIVRETFPQNQNQLDALHLKLVGFRDRFHRH